MSRHYLTVCIEGITMHINNSFGLYMACKFGSCYVYVEMCTFLSLSDLIVEFLHLLYVRTFNVVNICFFQVLEESLYHFQCVFTTVYKYIHINCNL